MRPPCPCTAPDARYARKSHLPTRSNPAARCLPSPPGQLRTRRSRPASSSRRTRPRRTRQPSQPGHRCSSPPLGGGDCPRARLASHPMHTTRRDLTQRLAGAHPQVSLTRLVDIGIYLGLCVGARRAGRPAPQRADKRPGARAVGDGGPGRAAGDGAAPFGNSPRLRGPWGGQSRWIVQGPCHPSRDGGRGKRRAARPSGATRITYPTTGGEGRSSSCNLLTVYTCIAKKGAKRLMAE